MRLASFLLAAPLVLLAQGPPGAPQAPRTGKAGARVDLTGYWVSVISEDWRWRMVTPLKGDFAGVPVNAQARKVGEAWDPSKDEAAGLQCKAYGAPALMRVPGRVHITWQDDDTLKIETDAGSQTRLLHFNAKSPQDAGRSWQGYSKAQWEQPVQGLAIPDGFPLFARRTANQGRSLEVATTNLNAGYLRKNGVPYSQDTVLNEYYDYHKEPNGDEWFTVTTVVRDPRYLTMPFITSSDFKRQRDASGWDPAACSAR
jgi:hypothetical protein